MKKILLIFSLLILSIGVLGQSPPAFNYQAMLRNAEGTVLSDQLVQIQIHLVNEAGNPVYSESHETQTNEFGLINVVIGQGTSSDNLSLVEWANGPYFLELIVNGEAMGSSPLLSVPYALYAASGNEGPQGDQGIPGPKGDPGDSSWDSIQGGISYRDGNVGIGTDSPSELLDVDGNLRVRGNLIVDGDLLIEQLMKEIRALKEKAGFGMVADREGNQYRTVRIGKQIWMAENLKVTKFPDGEDVPEVESFSSSVSGIPEKAYKWNDDDEIEGKLYGPLYTWFAAVNGHEGNDLNPSGVQGVCPDGWHLPSDAEWKELEIFLGMSAAEADESGMRGTGIGGKLKEAGTDSWRSPNTGASNESGFAALPNGYNYNGFGQQSGAFFWSSTPEINIYAFGRSLNFNSSEILRGITSKKDGAMVRCVKNDSLSVTTLEVGHITTNYAEGGGIVRGDGLEQVSDRGLLWKNSGGSGFWPDRLAKFSNSDTFKISLSNLEPGTRYSVRAYATNNKGTNYGEEVTFTTSSDPVLPILSAVEVYGIRENSAHLTGELTNDGGSPVEAYGVCWSTSSGPLISDNHTTDGSEPGKFYSHPSGLEPATTYYFRTYATNEVGTAYSNEIRLTTLGSDPAVDFDGNSYQSVKIGDQIWMAENLKSTHYANGSPIPLAEDNETWNILTKNDKAYCWYNNVISQGDTYGALYTWSAAMNGESGSTAIPSGIQGVCPDGWHVPSDPEWQELEIYLGMRRAEAENSWRERGESIGSKLKESGNQHWESQNTDANNESGFTALPGGYRERSSEYYPQGFRWKGTHGEFWTATEWTDTTSITRHLMHDESYIQRSSNYDTKTGYSVRCIKD